MKPAADGTARVEFDVKFSRGRRGSRKIKALAKAVAKSTLRSVPPQVPKVTRLLVLGYHFERLVCSGVVRNYAELAQLTGLSKTRVTQIVNLTLIAPDIQAEILNLDKPTGSRILNFERSLRNLTAMPDWNEQRLDLYSCREE